MMDNHAYSFNRAKPPLHVPWSVAVTMAMIILVFADYVNSLFAIGTRESRFKSDISAEFIRINCRYNNYSNSDREDAEANSVYMSVDELTRFIHNGSVEVSSPLSLAMEKSQRMTTTMLIIERSSCEYNANIAESTEQRTQKKSLDSNQYPLLWNQDVYIGTTTKTRKSAVVCVQDDAPYENQGSPVASCVKKLNAAVDRRVALQLQEHTAFPLPRLVPQEIHISIVAANDLVADYSRLAHHHYHQQQQQQQRSNDDRAVDAVMYWLTARLREYLGTTVPFADLYIESKYADRVQLSKYNRHYRHQQQSPWGSGVLAASNDNNNNNNNNSENYYNSNSSGITIPYLLPRDVKRFAEQEGFDLFTSRNSHCRLHELGNTCTHLNLVLYSSSDTSSSSSKAGSDFNINIDKDKDMGGGSGGGGNTVGVEGGVVGDSILSSTILVRSESDLAKLAEALNFENHNKTDHVDVTVTADNSHTNKKQISQQQLLLERIVGGALLPDRGSLIAFNPSSLLPMSLLDQHEKGNSEDGLNEALSPLWRVQVHFLRKLLGLPKAETEEDRLSFYAVLTTGDRSSNSSGDAATATAAVDIKTAHRGATSSGLENSIGISTADGIAFEISTIAHMHRQAQEILKLVSDLNELDTFQGYWSTFVLKHSFLQQYKAAVAALSEFDRNYNPQRCDSIVISNGPSPRSRRRPLAHSCGTGGNVDANDTNTTTTNAIRTDTGTCSAGACNGTCPVEGGSDDNRKSQVFAADSIAEVEPCVATLSACGTYSCGYNEEQLLVAPQKEEEGVLLYNQVKNIYRQAVMIYYSDAAFSFSDISPEELFAVYAPFWLPILGPLFKVFKILVLKKKNGKERSAPTTA